MFIPLPELSPFASQRDVDLYFFQQEQFEDQQKWRKQLINFINKPSSRFYIENDLSNIFFLATGHGTNIGDKNLTKIPFSSRVILLDGYGQKTQIWASGECAAIFTKDGGHAFHCDTSSPCFSSDLKNGFGSKYINEIHDTKLNFSAFQTELKIAINATINRIKAPFVSNEAFYNFMNPEC